MCTATSSTTLSPSDGRFHLKHFGAQSKPHLEVTELKPLLQFYVNTTNLAVELEGLPFVVLVGYWRAEVNADVECLANGESDEDGSFGRCMRHFFAIDGQHICGFALARSCAFEKSSFRSYSSQTSLAESKFVERLVCGFVQLAFLDVSPDDFGSVFVGLLLQSFGQHSEQVLPGRE